MKICILLLKSLNSPVLNAIVDEHRYYYESNERRHLRWLIMREIGLLLHQE